MAIFRLASLPASHLLKYLPPPRPMLAEATSSTAKIEDLVQPGDLVGRVGHNAGRGVRRAVAGVVEAGEHLDGDDVGSRGHDRCGGTGHTRTVTGCDTGHVRAVVAEITRVVAQRGVDIGRVGGRRAAGAPRTQRDTLLPGPPSSSRPGRRSGL